MKAKLKIVPHAPELRKNEKIIHAEIKKREVVTVQLKDPLKTPLIVALVVSVVANLALITHIYNL